MTDTFSRLDPFQNVVNVQWDGAIEIPETGFTDAAITNPDVTAPHSTAMTISGWVWVPEETPSGTYPLMVFGGWSIPTSPIGGTSVVEAVVGASGTFSIGVFFEGVPFSVDPLVDGYPGFDYVGWLDVEVLPETGAPVFPSSPGLGIFAGACNDGVGGLVSPPANGCFTVPAGGEAVLTQRVHITSPLAGGLAPGEWHHFLASCDTGGLGVWGQDVVAAYLFVNGQNGVDYFPGFEGLVLASVSGGGLEGIEFVAGTGISITGRPAAIPRPSTQVNDWPQTPIRLADWQVYPRLIIPDTDIGNFFRLQDGVRKRVPISVAETIYGELAGNPPKKRPLWSFRGGASSFHKSLNRSTDGEFFKTGQIKTVKPPPVFREPQP